MKVLAVGDLIGGVGVKELKKRLIRIKRTRKNRFCNCKWRKCRRWNGNYTKEF